MRIALTIAKDVEGNFHVLYIGEDIDQAWHTFEAMCQECETGKGDFIEVAMFRHPKMYSFREFQQPNK